MREIKFRAFNTFNKEMWDYDHLILNGIYLAPTGRGLVDTRNGDFNQMKELIPMQFTGLLDKNGKEIYEEDIVTCEIHEREQYDEYYSGMPLVVSFDSQCAGFYPFTKASQWRSSIKDIVVIGNIHQNSELLETKPPQP